MPKSVTDKLAEKISKILDSKPTSVRIGLRKDRKKVIILLNGLESEERRIRMDSGIDPTNIYNHLRSHTPFGYLVRDPEQSDDGMVYITLDREPIYP